MHGNSSPIPKKTQEKSFQTDVYFRPEAALVQFTGSEAIFPLAKANNSGVNKTGKHLVSEHFDYASMLSLKTPHSKSVGNQNYKCPA